MQIVILVIRFLETFLFLLYCKHIICISSISISLSLRFDGDKALNLHSRRLLDPESVIGPAGPPGRLPVNMVMVISLVDFIRQ